MNHSLRFLLLRFAQFFGFAAIGTIPFLAVYCDLFLLNNSVQEQSIVEYCQDAILAIMALLFAKQAQQQAEYRSGFVLITGFILCMLIREMDQFFDQFRHSLWILPASIVAIVSITYALLHAKQTIAELSHFVRNHYYFIFMLGLVIVLVSSRLLGTKYIWQQAMGEHYLRIVKHIIEECLELLGYCFMLASTILFSRTQHINKTSEL